MRINIYTDVSEGYYTVTVGTESPELFEDVTKIVSMLLQRQYLKPDTQSREVKNDDENS